MYAKLTTAAKRALWTIGFDVQRSRPWSRHPYHWLRELKAQTILDIGANEGQSAAFYRDIFPHAKIWSFEPLRDTHQKLVANRGTDPKFRAINVALGDDETRAIIHRSSFHPSSSILEMSEVHKEAYPYTAGETSEEVQLRRLDNLVEDGTVQIVDPLLIKMDVQGFELEVIKGGRKTISGATAVIAEISFVELYAGQPLAADVWNVFRDMGFTLGGILDVATHPVTNRPLQADAMFLRK